MKPLALMSIFALPSSMLANFVSGMLKCLVPQFFQIAISAGVAVISFVILCVIFNVIEIKALIGTVKKFKDIKVMKKKQKQSA